MVSSGRTMLRWLVSSLRARTSAAALAWVLLALVAASPSIAARLTGRTLSYRDTAQLYEPVRPLVTDALRSGRLPLWNPYEGTGKPLFAEGIHGVLHPLSVLAAFLDPGGVDLLVALYLAAAALGAALLARELGVALRHAVLAGLAYALSGYVTSMTGNLVFLAGAASIPWQVAALSAAGRDAALGVPAAALATAVTLFSGDAQMAAVAALLGAALAWERGGGRGFLRAAAGVALGALLAGVQLAATAVAVERSPRMWEPTGAEDTQWALSPWRLPELAVPGLFMHLDDWTSTAAFRWLGGTRPYLAPFAPSVYLGVPCLALAASSPLRSRRVRLLGVAAVILLWLALGHYLGARQALGWLPVWRSFHYSEKFVAPLSLVLAVLAAYGAQGEEGAGPPRRRLLVSAAALAAVAPLALGTTFLVTSPPLDPLVARDPLEVLRASLVAGLPHALAGAAALSAAAVLAKPGRRRAAALTASVTATLLLALPFATRPADPARRCGSPRLLLEAPPPGPRVHVPYFDYRADRFPGIEPFDLDECTGRRLGVPSWNVRERFDALETYGGLGSKRFVKLQRAVPPALDALYRRFGVTHVGLAAPGIPDERALYDAATSGARRVASDPVLALELFEVPHRAWASFPRVVTAVPGPQEALDLLVGPPGLPLDAAVVESSVPVPAGSGRVLSVLRKPERVRVEVEARSAGLLVVNDAFWPGWRARVDGVPAPILAADVLVRGVVVPVGRHVVEMEYAPPEVQIGLALSAAGALGVALLALRALRRRRAAAAGPASVPGEGELPLRAPGPF